MRLSACALLVAGASFIQQTVASPVALNNNDVAEAVARRRVAKRDGLTAEQIEALKYFHEPGLVCSLPKFFWAQVARSSPPTSVHHLLLNID